MFSPRAPLLLCCLLKRDNILATYWDYFTRMNMEGGETPGLVINKRVKELSLGTRVLA